MGEIIKATSSNITQYSYDEDIEVLTVWFKHGGVYEYFGVPEHLYQDMRAAESAGKFLNSQIKGTYEFKKVN